MQPIVVKKRKELQVSKRMQDATRVRFVATENRAENFFKPLKDVLTIVEKEEKRSKNIELATKLRQLGAMTPEQKSRVNKRQNFKCQSFENRT